MIFHSIIPYEVVFKDQEDASYFTRTLLYNGCQVEVTSSTNGTSVITRIHSTDLKHYLDPRLQPGMQLDNMN